MKRQIGFSKTQIQQLNEVLDTKFKKELKPIHKKLDKLQKGLDVAVTFFDTVTINHAKRITKIENNLQFSTV